MARMIFGFGVGWFALSLAVIAIGSAVESLFGWTMPVPEPIGLLVYFGWWCGGPLLMLVAGLALTLSKRT